MKSYRHILSTVAVAASLSLLGCGGELSADNSGQEATAASTHSTAASIVLNQSDPHFGGIVTFTTVIPWMSGSAWPMVAVDCYQNGALVYGQLDTPSAQFLLGGGSSVWIQNGGGAADCTVTLYSYSFKGNQETIQSLATTSFAAAAQ